MNSDVDTDIKDGAANDPSSRPVKYVAELCAIIILGLVILVIVGGYVEKHPNRTMASGREVSK